MRNKNLKIFNDYLQCLLRQEMLVLRKKIEKEHYDWKIIRNAIYNDCRFFETDMEFEFNTYLNTLEADKQQQLNKIVYNVLNNVFAHKMKSFPSKFKKKLRGILPDITPKQFFNLNYFDTNEHRCCLCGRLLDHDAKELFAVINFKILHTFTSNNQ